MVRSIVAMQFYLGFSEVRELLNKFQEYHLATEIAKELYNFLSQKSINFVI